MGSNWFGDRACLILVGVGLALAPEDWVEMVSGFDPDNGNGMVEAALAAIPIVIGIATGSRILLRRRERRRSDQLSQTVLHTEPLAPSDGA